MSDDFANPTERIAWALWDRKPSPVSDEEYEHNLYGNRVGVFGKMLGGLGLDASGERKAQPWGKAIMSTLDAPAGLASSIGQAVTAPARAYRGEIPEGQMVPEGLNFAGSVALGSAAVPRPANAAGMFGGRLAKTADHDALARAEELAAKGTPRETIWNDTGWFQGPDKKWRFEIDDSGAFIPHPTQNAITHEGSANGTNLRAALNHPMLFDAYPDLSRTKWMLRDGPTSGAYTSVDEPFVKGLLDVASDTPLGRQSVLLHESQHGVQAGEGFAPGSNVMAAGRDHPAIKDIEARIAKLAKRARDPDTPSYDVKAIEKRVAELERERAQLVPYYGQDAYHRSAGEVEARTVQKRMDMTPEERRARPPWLDYDVPEADQIVRFGGSGPQMSAPEVPGTLLSSASHLDMSPEARMARADALGFHPATFYHGTAGNISAFDLTRGGQVSGSRAGSVGVSISPDPAVANEFASIAAGKGGDPSVVALRARLGRVGSLTLDGTEKNLEVASTLASMWENGYDSAVLKNYTTPGGSNGNTILAVRDPSQLRSVNAAFDPAKSSSANLLAANPETSAAPGLGLMADDQDTMRRRRGLTAPPN